MGVHKGVTYGFNHCQYKGNQQGNLKKHILVVHERERYGCGEYDSTFGWGRDLKKIYNQFSKMQDIIAVSVNIGLLSRVILRCTKVST